VEAKPRGKHAESPADIEAHITHASARLSLLSCVTAFVRSCLSAVLRSGGAVWRTGLTLP
jgi:hypothetical protein